MPEVEYLPDAWRPEVIEARKRLVRAGWTPAQRMARFSGYPASGGERARLGINAERSVFVSRAEACGE